MSKISKNGGLINNDNQPQQKPTSLKKLEKLLKERMDDMNEELGEIQLIKGKYGRVRNCVNKKWKEYPIRVDELKKVIELLNN